MERDFDATATLAPPSPGPFAGREPHVAHGEETRLAVQQRLARVLARDRAQEQRFLRLQRDGFVPDRGIAARAGLGDAPVLIDAFVQPIEDSVTARRHGLPGIVDALGEGAETVRHAGAVGYDFSRLRPAGAKVMGGAVRAAGPVPFLRVFDAAGQALARARARRPLQSALLRIDHPDVERFVEAAGMLATFELALGVTDAFMQALADDGMFALVHGAEPPFAAPTQVGDHGSVRHVYRTLHARTLWERIVRAGGEAGPPRLVYLDAVNRRNNLRYCETIEATTPAHQPLAAYGCSARGAHDLTRFVLDPFSAKARFDHAALASANTAAVEMLDRALDVTGWPLPQHAAQGAAKRILGIGFFGLSHALAMLGLRHGTAAAAAFGGAVTRTLRDSAYRASVQLAERLGSFPLFDADAYLQAGTLASTLAPDLQQAIRRHGMRHGRLLSLAPMHTPSHTTPREQLALLASLAAAVDAMGCTLDVPDPLLTESSREWMVQAWRAGLPGCALRTFRTARAEPFRT